MGYIKYAISHFYWRKAFENLSVDRKVNHLNETLLNIFRNYVPNKKLNVIIVNLLGLDLN